MQVYGRKVAEAILGDYLPDMFDIRDNGIYPKLEDLEVLQWNPACDMEGADAPDPLESPSLPFPFAATHLAAFMLDGIGCLLPSIYGPLGGEPSEEMLRGLGIRATKAREALREAYAAYRSAESVVGCFDHELETRMLETADKCDEANGLANRQEKVFEPGISFIEATSRRARARKAVETFRAEADSARSMYEEEHAAWRKSMVRVLLQPQLDGPEATLFVEPDPAHDVIQALSSIARSPIWAVIKPQRFPGYRAPLYRFLSDAHRAGKSCPKAREVLDAWRESKPPEIEQVLSDGVNYYDSEGNVKAADLNAIRQAIKRLTSVR